MIRSRLACLLLAVSLLAPAFLARAQDAPAVPAPPAIPEPAVEVPPPPTEPPEMLADPTVPVPAPPEIPPPPPSTPETESAPSTPLVPQPAAPPALPERFQPKAQKKKSSAPPVYDAQAVQFTIRYQDENDDFLVKLRPDLAPLTVENFKRQVESGFYNGLAVHRVVQNYLLQTGDPLTRDDAQKEAWGTTDSGPRLPGEFKGGHDRYVLGMARKPGEAESSGSQFYITLRDAPHLDGAYAVFGEVTEGREVLNRLNGVVVDSNDAPLRRIEVVEARLVPATTVLKPGAQVLGGRRMTKPASQKSGFTRFIERIW